MPATSLHPTLMPPPLSSKEQVTLPPPKTLAPKTAPSMKPQLAFPPAFALMGVFATHTTISPTTLAGPLHSSTNNATTPAVPLSARDDHHGAMLFIVATICVYGLSIVFFIAGHTKKRENNKDEERQISHYLKRLHLEEPSMDMRKYHVIRLKSQMLAESALGQRHNRRMSLMPRFFEPCVRREEQRTEDADSERIDGEEGEERESGSVRTGSFFKNDCHVQNVNEQWLSKPAAPFRGRRYGCVGLGTLTPLARPGESESEGHDDGVEGEVVDPHRSLIAPSTLPSIKEDENSTHSLADVLLPSQPRDSAEDNPSDPEGQEPDVSSRILQDHSPINTSQPPPQAYAVVTRDHNGSECYNTMEENLHNELCGHVVITRL